MFSLQRILGQDKKFFELLEASAAEAQSSIMALKQALNNVQATPNLAAFVAPRRRDKKITNEISELLCRTFVTALEREDIEALSAVLYKIPKTVEKFAERYAITFDRVRDVDFSRHLELLERAVTLVKEMVQRLHNQDLKGLVELNAQLQKVEADGDHLIQELNTLLYSGKYDPLKAIILKDLFELLERTIDRCRSAGNVMYRIALKHS